MDRLCCPYCGDVIGVYEPARVILDDGSDLTGSLLTLHLELQSPGSSLVHERCYAERDSDRQND
jgi:hypothetical protein